MKLIPPIPERTPEQEAAASNSRRHGDRDSQTRLSYWFPKIRDAGLPVPRTEFVHATDEEIDSIWGWFDGETRNVEDLLKRIEAAGRAVGGPPFFLRTDFTSAKHSWKSSCFLTDPSALPRHVYELAEYSACADFLGLPFDVFVAREILPTTPVFSAFWGKMPITREFRVFARDGAVEHVQPYWPPASIFGQNPSVDDWEARLAEISALDETADGEVRALGSWASRVLGGFWSVDVLAVDGRGWVLTDMAEGNKSFRWDPKEG